MLIKEYRIPLPLTVEEYRIAQLYMIAKKSRTESSGQGNGVQILINEPYQDGPGGNGQYTKKIYHVGQHLPGWIKSLLPENALSVGEEAWNAYPFTKTRYTCPFVEKFSLDIETYYFPDDGNQENVFKLSGSDLRNRSVDVIDIVKDQPSGKDYVREEDPKLYMSEKTRRGPLDDDWLVDYWNEICREGKQPTCTNKSMMCAYKLCRVEFRYWGMQTKLEKFIHETALRKTMLRAHRQAWAWQDEWVGFSMEDIREYERQTQVMLAKKMAGEENGDDEEDEDHSLASDVSDVPIIKEPPVVKEQPPSAEASSDEEDEVKSTIDRDRSQSIQLVQSKYGSKGALHSPVGSAHSFDVQQHAKAVTNKSNKERVANWRMERLEVDSKSGSEEEFFDCVDTLSLAKWSSLEILGEEEESPPPHVQNTDDSIFNHAYLQRAASARSSQKPPFRQSTSLDRTNESPPGSPNSPPCKTSILILVVHAGSVLDATNEASSKKSDITTFRGAFESVMRQHYPSLLTHVAIKLVQCPSVATDALGLLSSLSPYSFNASPVAADLPNISDVPIGAIPLLSVTSPLFHEAINKFITEANQVFHNFVKSDDGTGFSGQVALVGDSMGSLLAYEALCRQKSDDEEKDKLNDLEMDASKLLKAPSPRRRRSSSSSDTRGCKLDFDVGDFFMFGSPLALILAARKLCNPRENLVRPHCGQMYNIFHPTDPTAARLEPLLSARFSMLSPVNIPRYAKFPLGNGVPMHLLETIQSHPTAFNDIHHQRRLSDASMQSTASGLLDNVTLSTITAIQSKWWGTKRLDFALYCPEGLSNFPAHALPHLFHASFWESCDVIAFILRQVGKFEGYQIPGANGDGEQFSFSPGQAREKWIRKRTSVKLKNMTANHRANDVIALEGKEQRIHARFNYGPLDVMTLAGEKVDIHIMKDDNEWSLLSTEITDKNGRISYSIPEDKHLGYGIYPFKMVVRGDHTHVDFFMAIIPPKTECVVFSIDGSFTASMSVTGRDPKVRAGAVDVCRHWQELGYLLIYITGRPDIQQHKVVSWLSQHNFPHGLISFADGLLTDPLGYKTAYLNNLVQNHCIVINAAYGSSKDIAVYQNVGLKASQIYIVGKASKKIQLQAQATFLSDGYAAHLNNLQALGGSRPAQGNARMVIPRGCFNLPGQPRRRSKETAAVASPIRSGYFKRKTYLSHV